MYRKLFIAFLLDYVSYFQYEAIKNGITNLQLFVLVKQTPATYLKSSDQYLIMLQIARGISEVDPQSMGHVQVNQRRTSPLVVENWHA